MAFSLAIAGIIAALAGTAVKAKADSDANRARQRQIRAAQENADRFDREANLRNNKTIDQLNEDPREERRQEFQADNEKAYDSALKEDRDEILGGEAGNVAGKVSDAFKTERVKRTAKVLANSVDLAKRAAKYQSVPQSQNRNAELYREGRVNIGGIIAKKRGQARVDATKLANIHANRGLTILSQVLQGVGTAASLGSSFGSTAAGAAGQAGTGSTAAGFYAPNAYVPKTSFLI